MVFPSINRPKGLLLQLPLFLIFNYNNSNMSNNDNVVISAQNLTKIYNNNIYANKDINLQVCSGEIFGLLGENGAGKTTFVKQLLGLLKSTSGSLQVLNFDVNKEPEKIKEKLNYLGQNPYALWHLTVKEAIYYTALLKKVNKQNALRNTTDLLEEFELTKIANRYLAQLSGGLLRLVNFLMSIVSPCEILVLDEPTSGLDILVRKKVWEKIIKLNKQNITIFLVTHDVLEAEKVLYKIGFIKQGQLVAQGSVGDLKKQFAEKLRVEVVLKNEDENTKNILLQQNFKQTMEKRFVCWKEKSEVQNFNLFKELNNENIDEIKIASPSLEDVYLRVMEKE